MRYNLQRRKVPILGNIRRLSCRSGFSSSLNPDTQFVRICLVPPLAREGRYSTQLTLLRCVFYARAVFRRLHRDGFILTKQKNGTYSIGLFFILFWSERRNHDISCSSQHERGLTYMLEGPKASDLRYKMGVVRGPPLVKIPIGIKPETPHTQQLPSFSRNNLL